MNSRPSISIGSTPRLVFPGDKFDAKESDAAVEKRRRSASTKGDTGFGADAFFYEGALMSGSSGSPIGYIKDGKIHGLWGIEQSDRAIPRMRSFVNIMTPKETLPPASRLFTLNGGYKNGPPRILRPTVTAKNSTGFEMTLKITRVQRSPIALMPSSRLVRLCDRRNSMNNSPSILRSLMNSLALAVLVLTVMPAHADRKPRENIAAHDSKRAWSPSTFLNKRLIIGLTSLSLAANVPPAVAANPNASPIPGLVICTEKGCVRRRGFADLIRQINIPQCARDRSAGEAVRRWVSGAHIRADRTNHDGSTCFPYQDKKLGCEDKQVHQETRNLRTHSRHRLLRLTVFDFDQLPRRFRAFTQSEYDRFPSHLHECFW